MGGIDFEVEHTEPRKRQAAGGIVHLDLHSTGASVALTKNMIYKSTFRLNAIKESSETIMFRNRNRPRRYVGCFLVATDLLVWNSGSITRRLIKF